MLDGLAHDRLRIRRVVGSATSSQPPQSDPDVLLLPLNPEIPTTASFCRQKCLSAPCETGESLDADLEELLLLVALDLIREPVLEYPDSFRTLAKLKNRQRDAVMRVVGTVRHKR